MAECDIVKGYMSNVWRCVEHGCDWPLGVELKGRFEAERMVEAERHKPTTCPIARTERLTSLLERCATAVIEKHYRTIESREYDAVTFANWMHVQARGETISYEEYAKRNG